MNALGVLHNLLDYIKMERHLHSPVAPISNSVLEELRKKYKQAPLVHGEGRD